LRIPIVSLVADSPRGRSACDTSARALTGFVIPLALTSPPGVVYAAAL